MLEVLACQTRENKKTNKQNTKQTGHTKQLNATLKSFSYWWRLRYDMLCCFSPDSWHGQDICHWETNKKKEHFDATSGSEKEVETVSI